MLAELLSTRRWLLADGATGTNLFDMGLLSGNAPELWNEEQPDKIRLLHQRFVDAGADIILTNTFGANRRRLALHKAEARTVDLNERAARLAREVADGASRPVVVAGSVGPTGDLLVPLGPLSEEEATKVFVEQMTGLKAGGADVIWIETMSAVEEMRAAANAAIEVDMPYTLTASFDTAGRTMMGLTPTAFTELVSSFPVAPLAIGANCGVGASDTLTSVLAMTEALPGFPVISKANAGVPRVSGDQVIYSGSPALMNDYAHLAADSGARIIGGCCGTSPEHLAAMRAAIDTHQPGDRPDLGVIEATTGKLASPPPSAEAQDAATSAASAREERRRRG